MKKTKIALNIIAAPFIGMGILIALLRIVWYALYRTIQSANRIAYARMLMAYTNWVERITRKQ